MVRERRLVFLAFVRSLSIVWLALLLAWFAAGAPSFAQAPQSAAPAGTPKGSDAPASVLPAGIAAMLSRATAALADVEKGVQHISQTEGDLAGLRAQVEDVLDSTTQVGEKLRPQLAAVKSQIDKLGPAPGKDGPAEASDVAAERGRLMALAATYDGAIKTSELTWVRARQLIERITVLRHALFAKNLMERQPSPLTPSVWRENASNATNVQHQFIAWAQHWWSLAHEKQGALGTLLGGVLILFLLLKAAMRWLTSRRGLRREPPQPTFFERAVSAVWVAPLRAVPTFAAGFALYIGLDARDLMQGNPWGRLVPAILKALFIYAAVASLVRAVLAPGSPQWRVVPIADRPARRVNRLLGAIVVVYVIDGLLTEVSRAFYVPLSLTVAQSTATSIVFAALLMGLLLTPFTPQDAAAAGAYSRHSPRWLKIPLWGIAFTIVAAALLGYVAFARFATQQVLLAGIVVLLGWLGYLAIRAFTREPTRPGRAVSDLLEHRFGLDEPRRRPLARLTELVLTLALALCAIPILMLQWGFSAADIRDGLTSVLFGMEIGQIRISLVRILGGVVLFVALLFAIRLLQRWLRDTLQQSLMDAGIANSVEAVAGYALIALAALLAVSYAGFDITSLAIVAGALSLGIGFGLQSIVNNFVSGLILLIERPIKVGDRLIVGDQQGHVRRISVRATEIETFDRVSLIIPNSELITGRVLNWTHRDQHAAFNVKVGVAYSADPEQVIAILLKCAEAHPQVLRVPPPSAVLEGFGDNALLFNLRVTLPDVGIHGGVQSDLRVAILKALREAEIEIPFNQVHVTLGDLETMRRYLDEALERPGADGRRSEKAAT